MHATPGLPQRRRRRRGQRRRRRRDLVRHSRRRRRTVDWKPHRDPRRWLNRPQIRWPASVPPSSPNSNGFGSAGRDGATDAVKVKIVVGVRERQQPGVTVTAQDIYVNDLMNAAVSETNISFGSLVFSNVFLAVCPFLLPGSIGLTDRKFNRFNRLNR